jgi:hypothetical protein
VGTGPGEDEMFNGYVTVCVACGKRKVNFRSYLCKHCQDQYDPNVPWLRSLINEDAARRMNYLRGYKEWREYSTLSSDIEFFIHDSLYFEPRALEDGILTNLSDTDNLELCSSDYIEIAY